MAQVLSHENSVGNVFSRCANEISTLAEVITEEFGGVDADREHVLEVLNEELRTLMGQFCDPDSFNRITKITVA